jgi:hypothetical protein
MKMANRMLNNLGVQNNIRFVDPFMAKLLNPEAKPHKINNMF